MIQNPKKRKIQHACPIALRGRHLDHLRLGDSCEGALTNVMSHIPLADMDPYIAARTCTWIRDLYRDDRCKLWSQLHARNGGAHIVNNGTMTSAEVEREARKRCNRMLRADLIDRLTSAESKDFQKSGFRKLKFYGSTSAHLPDGTVRCPKVRCA